MPQAALITDGTVIVCGISKGTTKAYKCPYCDFESDDLDEFATAMCWGCVYEEEPPTIDDFDEDLAPPLDEVEILEPCPVCHATGACGYDDEGRALIHSLNTDDAAESAIEEVARG